MKYILITAIYLSTIFSASYSVAFDAYKNNNQEVALNIISELIKKDSKNDKYYDLASKIYYSIGDLDKSNTNILKAIEIKSDSEDYREYQKQLEELKNGIKSAQKTFDNGYVEESLSEYEVLIKKFPNSPVAYYSIGLIYLKTGNYGSSVNNLNKALEINPYNEEKYNKSILSISQRLAKKGDEQYRIREFNSALELYLEAVDYYPEFVAVLYRISNVYQQLNDYYNAKVFAERTIVYDNAHFKAMKTLGDLHYRMGDAEESARCYNKSIAINSNYYKAYYSLAQLFNDQGKVESAIENLNSAIQINPKYDKAYILLGVIYSDSSNYENAILNFNEAVSLNSKNYKVYFRLAEVYNKSSRYSRAKESAKNALKIKKNYAGAYFELGYAELFMCNKVAAQDAFEKAKRDKTYRKSAKHYLENLNQLFSKNCN